MIDDVRIQTLNNELTNNDYSIKKLSYDGILKKFGFPNSCIAEDQGYAGRLWIGWKNEDFGMRREVVERKTQFAHLLIHDDTARD